MRYLDGELPPEERERVRRRLDASTEARRELAVFRAMKDDLQSMPLPGPDRERGVWDRVARSVARPAGWLLLSLGSVIWGVYGVYVFATSQANAVEKVGTAAVVVGVLTLLASVIWERYREWNTDPYRHVQR